MKKLPLILSTLVLLASLPVAVFLTNQSQITFPSRASSNGVTLSLTPAQGDITSYGLPVNIVLATGEKQVTKVNLVLSFNPKQVSVSENRITPSSFVTDTKARITKTAISVDPASDMVQMQYALTFEIPVVLNGSLGSFTVIPDPGFSGITDINIAFTGTSSSSNSSSALDARGQNILVNASGGRYSIH